MNKTLRQTIREVMESNPANDTVGISVEDMAEAFDCSPERMNIWLNELEASGDVLQVTRDTFKWIQGPQQQERSVQMFDRLFTLPRR